MTNDCKTCHVSTGAHKPAEALHQIDEPQAEALLELAAYRFTVTNREARIAELEKENSYLNNACAELEAQLEAIGAGGVEPLRKPAAAPQAVQAAVPLPLLLRDIARDLGITVPQACIALKPLGNYSTNSAVTAEMARMLRDHFPAPAHPAEAVPAQPLQKFESPRAKILMQAWQEGFAACRDAEYVGEEAENDAFNQSMTLNHCIAEDELHATQPAEGAPAQAPQNLLAELERIAEKYAWAFQDAGTETYAEQVQAKTRKAKQALTAELKSALATHTTQQGMDARQWLQQRDFEALERFEETSKDDESYDIGKEAIHRLTHFGCLNSHGFGRYSITAFGSYVLDNWSLARELPFKMQSERDAEHRAALADQAKQGEQANG